MNFLDHGASAIVRVKTPNARALGCIKQPMARAFVVTRSNCLG